MLKQLLTFGAIAAVSIGTTADAKTVTFGDGSIHFPGWESSNPTMNSLDVNGLPNILGGSVEYDQGYITSITFDYLNKGHLASELKPSDLFLDLGANQDWDYVVDLGDPGNVSGSVLNPGSYDLLDFTGLPIALGASGYGGSPANNPGYILTQNANRRNGGAWGGILVRDDHPYALTEQLKGTASSAGSVNFSGWNDPANPSGGWEGFSATFDFTLLNGGLGFYLGQEDQLALGFTVNCGNDVIYESLNLPMPEPTSWMLMGTGLLGLVGQAYRRKRRDETN